MQPLSEQVRELEERVEQLQRERDAQIVLNRLMLSDEQYYAERRQEFRQLQAKFGASPTTIIQGKTIVDVTPAMLRRPSWN